jgi:cytochrome c oxidase subunit IV
MESQHPPSAVALDEPVAHARPNYIGIWVALGVLTGIELGVAFLPWPKTTLILILVGLAIWKALLVALYYMHLRFERRPLRVLAIAPLPFCIILLTAGIMERFN